jgi:hypothetical protein
MSTSQWTKALGIVGAVWVAAAATLANPVQAPKRVVGSQTVDLTPLFRWWTNQSGARPLTGWVHVTGTVVGTNTTGWVVDAHVETKAPSDSEEGAAPAKAAGTRRILLRHPPLQDRVAFDQLAGQLKVLNYQRAQVADAEAEAHRYLHPGSNGVRRVEFKSQGWEHREVRITEQNAAAEKKRLDYLIQQTKAKLSAWASPDHYELDCFALPTGTAQNRLPVYEHGMSY